MFNEINTIDATTDATACESNNDGISPTSQVTTPKVILRSGPPAVGDPVDCKVVKVLIAKGNTAPHAILGSFGSAIGMLRPRDFCGTDAEIEARMIAFKRGDDFKAIITRADLNCHPARFDLSEKLAVGFAHAYGLVGSLVEASIGEVTKFGAFLDIGEGISGVLFTNEMSGLDQRKRHQELKKGEKVNVTIVSVQPDDRNPLKLRVTLSEIDAALEKAAALTGKTLTAQVLGPCNSGTRLLLNGGVEAVLPPENLGGTAETSLKKGNNLKVKVLGIEGRSLLVTRDGIGGTNARAIQESKRAARRQRDQALRSSMQGSSGGGGGNKGGKGKK